MTMETFAINATTGASTHYTGYDFTAMCRGHDGRYYGIKADGLYLLNGPANSVVDFGDINFGTSAEKKLATAYATYKSDARMNMSITAMGETYEYPARSLSDVLNTERFDIGKGLRANHFGVGMSNTDGEYFELESAELAVVATTRRI